MKRILTLALALLLCLSLAAPALADVIYEPEDAFYKSHRDECEYVNQSYIVSASGVEILTKPGGSKIGSYAAGETIYSDYIYTDPKTGDVWGSAMFRDGNDWKEGWVRLTGMQLVYGYAAFAAEYNTKIYPAGENTPSVCLCDTKIVEWAYPGAPEPVRIMEREERPDADDSVREELTLYFGTLFDDENGNQWGFLGYWRGRRNTWVCLTDPAAESLPVRDITPQYVEKDAASGSIGADGDTLLWLAAALVAAVVVVTVFLLVRRKKGMKAT